MKQIPGQINMYTYTGTEKPKRKRRKKVNRSTLRNAWEQYGIDKARYRELRDYCRDRKNGPEVAKLAYETNGLIGEHIFQSVTKGLSYESIAFLDGHMIPCGRTDFYGYRRQFYSKLNERIKNETT